ncbi:MAG TPA: carboxypeptidase-like regulatory domain-containing protein, partial [Vicinamibacterales bacterium]|nr:carboxypeptidase-like regulatory domain-containing protein [Vicinamibacterales bacterium]
ITPIIVTNGSNFVADFELAPGGRIAGRVTDSITGQGIAGVRVVFVPQSGEVAFTWATTDANGDYISEAGTDTGTVFAATFNTAGYQNEVWDNVKCMGCDWTVVGTPMPVTIGVTTGGFDFALDVGGVITGTVRDVNLAPIPNIEVTVYDSTGEAVEVGVTDAFGNYTTGGLVTGTYYVGTNNDSGWVDEVYDNIRCVNGNCDSTVGQPVAVTLGAATPGVDFVLEFGGNITGTITNAATGLPILDNVFVNLMDATGAFIGGANTDKDTGMYTAQGVPPGTYYANVGYTGFFNQLYNGVNCAPFCPFTSGTPIHVAAGATTANINFALVPTTSVGTITGTVNNVTGGFPGTPVSNFSVQVFSIGGAQVANGNTDLSGVYTFSNLAPGSYYVRTNGGGQLINQLHNGVNCQNCNVTTSGGTLVPVTVGGTATINFNLTNGGRISGTVTNAAGGAPLQSIGVVVFSSTGVNMGLTNTNASGVYTTRGLPAGTYYLRTQNTLGFVDELHDNQFCPGPGCNVTNGTPVVVTGTATTSGRDFALAQGGRISGNLSGPLGPIQFNANVQVFTSNGTFLGNAVP